MLKFYAVHPRFYSMLYTHKDCLQELIKLPYAQRLLVFMSIEKSELSQSALSFFGTTIYERGNEVLCDMQIHHCSCSIQDGIAELDDEKNPFFELLCRKYPCYLVVHCE